MKAKPVILIVDDHPQNIELLEAYLVPQGYEIVKAANGEEALVKLCDNQIDLILLDVLMPGIDGFEVIRRVRQDKTHRLLPIILVTVMRETEDRIKGIEAGCDDFISHPIDKMELLARVRSLLKAKDYNDLMSKYQKELEAEVTRRTEELQHALENLRQDIIARKQSEEALRESEERFRKIFEEAYRVGIVIISPSLIFEKPNPAFCRMMGYSENELQSMTFAGITHPDHINQDMDNVKKVGRGEIPYYQTEKQYIHKSGKVLWGNLTVSIILDKQGALKYYLALVIDITEQKKGVELLLEANKKYKELAESISDVFFAMDKNLKYTYWNPASEQLTGITAEKALGKSIMELFPDNEARKQVIDMYSRTIDTKKPKHLTVNYPGDELIVHEITSYPTQDGVSVFIKDVTDLKKSERQLHNTLEMLRRAFSATVKVIASAVEARDPYTAGHQIRSSDLARAIATEMGLPQEKIDAIRVAGSIHDLGKLSIPAEILSKPTKLSEIEFSLIKEHAQKGYELLKDVESSWPLAEIVRQHHERMDGSGYPRNLKGEDILIEARIIAVADVVEAMASHRPYRPAFGMDKALEEITQNKGILYDPDVVDACLSCFREKRFKLAD